MMMIIIKIMIVIEVIITIVIIIMKYYALKSSQRDEPVKKLTLNIKNWILRH